MRTYVLFGLLAVALLALPAAVAADTYAQTHITGSVTTSITVTVDDSSLDLGTMNIGMNPAGTPGYVTTTVHVATTGPVTGWSLKAKDTGTLKTGWLLSGSTFLDKALGFAWDTTDTWGDLTTERSIGTGSPPGGDVPVFFRQEVIAGDPPGSYTMTVEFNGYLA